MVPLLFSPLPCWELGEGCVLNIGQGEGGRYEKNARDEVLMERTNPWRGKLLLIRRKGTCLYLSAFSKYTSSQQKWFMRKAKQKKAYK